MKTAVRVRLVATHEVVIAVEHEPGESPTHLTPEEEERAIGKGGATQAGRSTTSRR